MSNWLYGQEVPTDPWRSAMTVPRELMLSKINNEYWLKSRPVAELAMLRSSRFALGPMAMKDSLVLEHKEAFSSGCFDLTLRLQKAMQSSFSVVLKNKEAEQVVVAYDGRNGQVTVSRGLPGKVSFSPSFTSLAIAHAPVRRIRLP